MCKYRLINIFSITAICLLMFYGISIAVDPNYMHPTGNVGLGTGTEPEAKVEITKIYNDSPGNGYLEIGNGGGKEYQFRMSGAGTERSLMLDHMYMFDWWADTPTMTWRRDNPGFIGIKNTDPQSMLHLPRDRSIQIGGPSGDMNTSTYMNTFDASKLGGAGIVSAFSNCIAADQALVTAGTGGAIVFEGEDTVFYHSSESVIIEVMRVDGTGEVIIDAPDGLAVGESHIYNLLGLSTSGGMNADSVAVSGDAMLDGSMMVDTLSVDNITAQTDEKIVFNGNIELNGSISSDCGLCLGTCP